MTQHQQREMRVGVLGATGAVGQRFVELLSTHPWFRVVAVGASDKSAGKLFRDAARWNLTSAMPEVVGAFTVQRCSASAFAQCDLVFSGLDASVAGDIECEFAEAGIPVFSNAKNHRMHPDVPILIPLINADHIKIVKRQPSYAKSGGFIVTNANCSSTGLSVALAPIHRACGGITEMVVATLQAISGAGYPGIPSYDILDNVVPFISGEEDKIEVEPCKILGSVLDAPVGEEAIAYAPIKVVAMCHRVPVVDGHTISVSLKVKNAIENIVSVCEEAIRNFKPSSIVMGLPSCPKEVLRLHLQDDRPQPRLDKMAGSGMTTSVGRLRKCPATYDLRFTLVSHNTILGAAGGSILNAELAVAEGLIQARNK